MVFFLLYFPFLSALYSASSSYALAASDTWPHMLLSFLASELMKGLMGRSALIDPSQPKDKRTQTHRESSSGALGRGVVCVYAFHEQFVEWCTRLTVSLYISIRHHAFNLIRFERFSF